VSEEDRSSAEKILVELARQATPHEVDKAADEILARMDQDGKEPKDPDPSERKPELRVQQRKDGWFDIDGQLDPITGTRLSTILDPLATPRPAGEDKWPDLRTTSQRYGEAFGEAIAMLANVPDVPGGDRAHLVVTVSLTDLKTKLGTACLDMVSELTATETRMLACDCQIIPAVLGSKGEPLDLGRAKRLVTPALRKALIIRDRGCAFPGCHRKPRHCDAHHLIEWAHGGLTVLRNLVLLCSAHHRLLHSSPWTVHIAEDGIPTFVPPDYVDPLRSPRRNNLHHPSPKARSQP
ncbi:HNH endonuclease signature motif containing protein, partial [Amycolatopsis samaneae]